MTYMSGVPSAVAAATIKPADHMAAAAAANPLDLTAALSEAFQSCPRAGIIYRTFDEAIVAVNQAALRVFRATEADLVGHTLSHILRAYRTPCAEHSYSSAASDPSSLAPTPKPVSGEETRTYWLPDDEAVFSPPSGMARASSVDSSMGMGSPSSRMRYYSHGVGGGLNTVYALLEEAGLDPASAAMLAMKKLMRNYQAFGVIQSSDAGELRANFKLSTIREGLPKEALSTSDRLETEYPSGLLDGAYSLDWDKIAEVARQLIDNAMKHDVSGKKVVFKIEASGPFNLKFSVIDEGPGFNPDLLTAIMTETVYDATSTSFKSGGLKILSCKKLVDAMRGAFTAVTELGKGSTFTFEVADSSTLRYDPSRMGSRDESLSPVRNARGGGAGLVKKLNFAEPPSLVDAAKLPAGAVPASRAVTPPKQDLADSRTRRQLDALGLTPERPVFRPTVFIPGKDEFRDGSGHAFGKLGTHVVRREKLSLSLPPHDPRVVRALVDAAAVPPPVKAAPPMADRGASSHVFSGAGDVPAPSAAGAALRKKAALSDPILVVDDDSVGLRLLARQLTKMGFTNVKTATGGEDAIRQAKENHFEVILMDEQMPDKIGSVAAAEILAWQTANSQPRSYIISCSSNKDVAALATYRAAGMENVMIAKPFDNTTIKGVLKDYVEMGAGSA